MQQPWWKYIIVLFVVTFLVYKSNLLFRNTPKTDTPSKINNQVLSTDNKSQEYPDKPSPRTIYSSRSPDQLKLWFQYQAKLKSEIAPLRKLDVLFLGDSITESLVGTNYGIDCSAGRCTGIADMFESLMEAHKITTHVSAISGDRTQHLLWRLKEGGELSSSLSPKAVVLLIGTNNLPRAALSDLPAVSKGIQEIVQLLRKRLPNSKIFVNEIFPRYDNGIQETNGVSYVESVNKLLEGWYHSHVEIDHMEVKHVQLLQCGDMFLAKNGKNSDLNNKQEKAYSLVNTTIMPDRLHPNVEGMKKWLTECVLPKLIE